MPLWEVVRAKLCWMVQNLDLGDMTVELAPENTQNPPSSYHAYRADMLVLSSASTLGVIYSDMADGISIRC